MRKASTICARLGVNRPAATHRRRWTALQHFWPDRYLLGHQSREQVFTDARREGAHLPISLLGEPPDDSRSLRLRHSGDRLSPRPTAEFVRHNHTGLLFNPGDLADLAEKVRYAFSHPEHPRRCASMLAREYEEKHTPERNYKMLIAIYEQAIENAQRRKRAAS